MRTDTPQPIRLSDYSPPAFLNDEIALDFSLEPTATRVKTKLAVRRNGEHGDGLFLTGERLKPISFAVDGRALGEEVYALTPEGVTIAKVPDAFTLET